MNLVRHVGHLKLVYWHTLSLEIYGWFMVFNATFNNISVISWRSVLLYPEKTTDLSQVTDKLYHIMMCTSPWAGFELTTSMVIGTDYIGSLKSNYHTMTTTTAPGNLCTIGAIFMKPTLNCFISNLLGFDINK
jgi:hypothetical protein